jgi:hypothetical protein
MARKPQSIGLRTFLCLLVIPVCPAPVAGQTGGETEILLASRPAHLLICNKYQQRMTGDELSALEPFVPMVVLARRETLGDRITPCSRLSILGETYYLLQNADGSFAGDPQRAGLIGYRNALLMSDTIIVRHGKALVMGNPAGTSTTSLRVGELVRREFQHAGATYVRRLDHAEPYGWVSLPEQESADWEKFRPVRKQGPADIAQILPIVQDAVARVNNKLTMLYQALQDRASPAMSPPAFHVERVGQSIQCRMVPAGRARQFRQTIAALAADLRRLASPLGAECAQSGDGLITIHR